MSCPVCQGNNVELTDRITGKEDHWKKEIYLCHDCDSSWDWTFERPIFRWPRKARAPRWVKID